MVSVKIKPGSSQGNPPNKKNLSNSIIIKTPAHNIECVKKLFVRPTSFKKQIGPINIKESKKAINTIIIKAI